MSDAPAIDRSPFARMHRVHQVPGLSQTQKGVLVALALHADDQGRCWPSVDTLAEYASVTDRAVQKALQALAALGLVDVHQQPGRTTVYVVHLDGLPERAPRPAPTLNPRTTFTPEPASPPNVLRRPPNDVHPKVSGKVPLERERDRTRGQTPNLHPVQACWW